MFLMSGGSQWCRHGERTSSKVCYSRDNDKFTTHGWLHSTFETGWQQLDKACTLFAVELAISEIDHAAQYWCSPTCTGHRWVIQHCSSLLEAGWVDTEVLRPVNSYNSQYVIWLYDCSLQSLHVATSVRKAFMQFLIHLSW